jgi:hypothetical protein
MIIHEISIYHEIFCIQFCIFAYSTPKVCLRIVRGYRVAQDGDLCPRDRAEQDQTGETRPVREDGIITGAGSRPSGNRIQAFTGHEATGAPMTGVDGVMQGSICALLGGET